MTAAPQPFPLLSRGIGRADSLAAVTARFGPAMSMALGFFCFLPYPSMPIGGASALQIGNILSMVLLIPALALQWRQRPVYLYPLILAPLVLSAVKAGLTGTDDLDLCFKDINVMAIACLTLTVTQLYAPRYSVQLLTGIAAATVLHVAVGLWQLYCFTSGEFPFAGLYVNQSFLSVQDNAEIIGKYIQRPFGIFPEPSAMASSLAPWILFWCAELCGVVQLRNPPARWQRILFAVAAIGALGLIILSGSGHTMITLGALLLIGLLGFRRLRATPRNFAIVLPVLGILVPLILWMAVTVMTSRIEGEYQVAGSWDDRTNSLIAGFSVYSHGDLPTIVFGIGPGLSPGAVWGATKLDAVFSVTLTYIYETGLVGAIAVGLIGFHLLRVWRASGWSLPFAAISFVWLVGITVTTSYPQLLPIWIALGWLTVWPAVCGPSAPLPESKRLVELGWRDASIGASIGASIETRRKTWTTPQDVVIEVQSQ